VSFIISLGASDKDFEIRVYFSKPKGKWISQGGRTVLIDAYDPHTDLTFSYYQVENL